MTPGETVPLSQAEKLLPQGLNPLSFTVIKRTGEFVADADSIKGDDDAGPGAHAHTLRGKLLSAGHKAAAAASAASKGVKVALREVLHLGKLVSGTVPSIKMC